MRRRSRASLLDLGTMTSRVIKLTLRQIDGLFTTVMLPIVLMCVFVYLFGGAIEPGGHYVSFIVPGVLLMCAGYGSSTTAISVSQDMAAGVIDRFTSLDISGTAILFGHVVGSMLRNLLSTVLVLATALLIGFRSGASPLAWLGALGMLVVYILAVSWLAAAIGLLVKSVEAANGFTMIFMFVPYPSSMFVPIHTMPSWLRGFATYQPINVAIETVRGLLLHTSTGSAPWQALAEWGGVMVLSIVLAGRLFRRRVS
jgi:ABC-2 type transport system permease protein